MSEPIPERKPVHWLVLALGGLLVHVALFAGTYVRILRSGPQYEAAFAQYNVSLPWLTLRVWDASQWMVRGDGAALWGLAGLVLLDFVLLAGLARFDRTLWKWWFMGVAVLLLLLLVTVEFAYLLPAWKLREALAR